MRRAHRPIVCGVEFDPIERTDATTYSGECRIGNLVADIYRRAADVGLVNSGSLRTGPSLAGDVTVGDLASAVPFSGPVAVAAVIGEELLETFRQGDSALVAFDDDTRWYAHSSGARLTYDHAERALVEATVGNEPIDPERAYTVATSAFVLRVNVEFPASRRVTGGERSIPSTRSSQRTLARTDSPHGWRDGHSTGRCRTAVCRALPEHRDAGFDTNEPIRHGRWFRPLGGEVRVGLQPMSDLFEGFTVATATPWRFLGIGEHGIALLTGEEPQSGHD
jgi:hypothetical protein